MRRPAGSVAALSLALCMLLSVGPSVGLECLKCEGGDERSCAVQGDSCRGDYCAAIFYSPKWGVKTSGQKRWIRGCMKHKVDRRPLLKSTLADGCSTYYSANEKADITSCLCSGRDYCNRHVGGLPEQRTSLLTCACEGAHCEAGRSTCTGEFCTLVRPAGATRWQKGCANVSALPLVLLERKRAGLQCSIPPISAALQHDAMFSVESEASTESCICATDYCNRLADGQPPYTAATLMDENSKCSHYMKATHPLLNGNNVTVESVKKQCTGQYCFEMRVEDPKDEQSQRLLSSGCVSLTRDATLAKELNSDGCVNFESSVFSLKACFEGGGGSAADKRYPNSSKNNKKTKPEEAAVNAPYVEVDEAPPTEEPPSSGNTLLVVVFVGLMVLIVIAGVVWKFELHKKILRAKYDTVAG